MQWNGWSKNRAAINKWVKDKLARFQQPVRWLTLPPELKNGGIKISRQALKEWVKLQQ